MLSFTEIKKDLDETQSDLNYFLDQKDYIRARLYSDKMRQIVVWFMQNGYLEL